MGRLKAIFSWSGGKDSSYALHKVLSDKRFEVKYLLTTISEKYQRVSMHGVRKELIELQSESIRIPLLKVFIKEDTNQEYEKQMESTLLKVKAEGIHHVIFGDIFLQDLREYRERNLSKVGMKGIFPLWKADTKWLASDFLDKGFKTITCCVSDGFLTKDWVGREVTREFIDTLPRVVDPCGENGEFHTFCFDGPIFENGISISLGEKVYKSLEVKRNDVSAAEMKTKGFWFCDLLLKKS